MHACRAICLHFAQALQKMHSRLSQIVRAAFTLVDVLVTYPMITADIRQEQFRKENLLFLTVTKHRPSWQGRCGSTRARRLVTLQPQSGSRGEWMLVFIIWLVLINKKKKAFYSLFMLNLCFVDMCCLHLEWVSPPTFREGLSIHI